ncbi:hypothetical protein [Mammaliicoccus sp. H-M34]|uniref:hypothetical protein n=1 Tax=Mammaliicoccus sp. H-M34 TaxID=2898693 RepID=UPI001EFBFD18|nr:hypothetical protein [Mammaliicoccus sp. H-M34]
MSEGNHKRQFGAKSSGKAKKINNEEAFHNSDDKNEGSQSQRTHHEFGASDKNKSSFIENFKKMFLLYDRNEWIKRYLISLIITLLFITMMGNSLWIVVLLNFLLFPFIISVVDDFIGKLTQKTSFAEQLQSSGCFVASIRVVIKYVFLYFVWGYSFILGLVSLVYMCFTARKM